jgi:predicted transcriptional regulator
MVYYGVYYMSKQAKLLNYLSTGAEVTAKQIAGSFGLKNPHRAIHLLRSQGHCVYSNAAKLADGTETTKYRIGKPSRRMIAAANAILGASAFTRQG